MDKLADDLIEGAAAIADETGFDIRKVYHLVDKGGLPVFKLGGRLHARRSELRAALSAGGHAATM